MPKGAPRAANEDALPTLQNLIKRDPDGYQEDFVRRLRHFQSIIEIQRQTPGAEQKELVSLLGFVSAVCPCYPELTAEVPGQLSSLLDEQLDALEPTVRRALFQALVLLRNRGMIEPLALLQLSFRCFRGRDKTLRGRLYAHAVADIKGVNAKHKDNALNRRLQNHVFSMLTDGSSSAAKYSLRVTIELYRKHVWRDTRTVNVVAGALFCPHPGLRIAALHFLLGAHDEATAADSDDEDGESMTKKALDMKKALGREGYTSQRNSKRAVRKQKRAAKTASKKPAAEAAASFAAIHLLHDPHAIGERLFVEVRKQGERFDVRLMMLNLLSRLIGAHRLLLPNFYPFVQRYMQPHQREITLVLAYLVQGCHELVAPESLSPLLRTLVNHFVSDKSRPEMVAIGLNTCREVCARVPLAMDATLLSDLLEYRKDKDKAVVAAARSLLQLFRQKMPEMLHKKYRGKGADVAGAGGKAGAGAGMGGARPAAYGALEVSAGVEGAELLMRHEERLRRRAEGEGVEWAGREGDAQEWEATARYDGEEVDSDALSVDEEDLLAEEEASEGEEGEEGEEEEAGDEDVAALQAELDEEGEEGEEGDDDEEEGAEEEMDEGEEADDEDEDDEDDEDEAAAAAAGGAKGVKAGPKGRPPPQRVDYARILTPRDFERIARLRQLQAEAAQQRGAKRKRAEEAMYDDAALNSGGPSALEVEGEAVDELDIAGVRARKNATREEKLESTIAGRTDRKDKYAKVSKKTGGLSNKEKKKNQPYMMARASRGVRSKGKNSEEKKRQQMRRDKKMFKGRVKR